MDPNFIIGGELNLAMSAAEFWGSSNVSDPLASYFKDIFDATGLIDIAPATLTLTWNNGRVGRDGLAKHLDIFLMNDNLGSKVGRYHTWSIPTSVFDHRSIALQLEFDASFNLYPFKFNSTSLEDKSFCDLVKDRWSAMNS